MERDVTQRIVLERAVPGLVKAHDDRHHFTQTQPLRSPAAATSLAEQVLLPTGLKLQTEVVAWIILGVIRKEF